MKIAYERARTLDLAQKNSEEFMRNVTPVYSVATGGNEVQKDSIVAVNPDQSTYYLFLWK